MKAESVNTVGIQDNGDNDWEILEITSAGIYTLRSLDPENSQEVKTVHIPETL